MHAKSLAWLKTLNSHRKWHICLTPKEVKTLVLALRSVAILGSETQRQYLLKIGKKIETQVIEADD